MPIRQRTLYFAVALVVVAIGLFVRRKADWFPDLVNLCLGDLLYTVAMFLAISVIAPQRPVLVRAVAALLICFAIELSQLYQADWINAVRRTLPGRLLLGSGFLWSDLLAYTLGVVIAGTIDHAGRRTERLVPSSGTPGEG